MSNPEAEKALDDLSLVADRSKELLGSDELTLGFCELACLERELAEMQQALSDGHVYLGSARLLDDRSELGVGFLEEAELRLDPSANLATHQHAVAILDAHEGVRTGVAVLPRRGEVAEGQAQLGELQMGERDIDLRVELLPQLEALERVSERLRELTLRLVDHPDAVVREGHAARRSGLLAATERAERVVERFGEQPLAFEHAGEVVE